MSKICLGAGGRPVPTFLNFDLFENDVVKYGPANNLAICAHESVDLIFSNAVFEHLELNEYNSIFSEWKRVLSKDGSVVCLGIPDFYYLCKLYLLDFFDENELYRFGLGVIEDKNNMSLYKAQIHKRFFSKKILTEIFESQFNSVIVFNYCYPSEDYAVNLGVVASNSVANINIMYSIPTLHDYINMDTIRL